MLRRIQRLYSELEHQAQQSITVPLKVKLHDEAFAGKALAFVQKLAFFAVVKLIVQKKQRTASSINCLASSKAKAVQQLVQRGFPSEEV